MLNLGKSMIKLLALSALWLPGLPLNANAAQEIVVPNAFANLESVDGSGAPFHLTAIGDPPSMRFQQLFNASQFGGATGVIDKISFRPDAVFGAAFSETNIDVEIHLSHKSSFSLVSRFDDNIGIDETLVLKTNSLALFSSFTGPIEGPKDFDITIDLQDTFVYNGVDHLLLDVKLFNAPTTTFFDAGSGGSWVKKVSSSTVDGTVGSEFGIIGNFAMLITKFSLTEPIVNIAIDVKPESYPNCFNINGSGVIPVAILGSADFDVQDVDQSSVRFAGLTVGVRGNADPQCNFEYSNGDDFEDLVCHFSDDPAAWSPDDGTATLVGELSDGRRIEGSDSICVRP